jgi:NADH pyrophosphatase NudC (nudix superfamily)
METYMFCPLCGRSLIEARIDGVARQKCQGEGCQFVWWDNPLPVVAAVVEHDGMVLIARNRAWPEKMFGLVTGFLEKGETPPDAVLREVLEETGLRGTVEGLIGVYPFIQRNQVIIAYHVITSGDVTLGDELAEYKLLPPEKVRPWPYGTGPALSDWLKARLN